MSLVRVFAVYSVVDPSLPAIPVQGPHGLTWPGSGLRRCRYSHPVSFGCSGLSQVNVTLSQFGCASTVGTPGVSWIVTVAAAGSPATTSSGNGPKPTRSVSSFTSSSSSAVMVNDFSDSPAAKLRRPLVRPSTV